MTDLGLADSNNFLISNSGFGEVVHLGHCSDLDAKSPGDFVGHRGFILYARHEYYLTGASPE